MTADERRIYMREWRARNREKINEYKRGWFSRNPEQREKQSAYHKKWYAERGEEQRERNRLRYYNKAKEQWRNKT